LPQQQERGSDLIVSTEQLSRSLRRGRAWQRLQVAFIFSSRDIASAHDSSRMPQMQHRNTN